MRQSRWILAVVLLLAQSCFPALWGDTIYSDIQREFSGSPLTNNNNGVATPAPQSCEATLTAEEAAGQIPGSESCYCPVGATTPTCVQNTSNQCQAVLADEQQRMGSGYRCTCPSGASTPQCVSYYQLCEDNLSYYQNSTNQCSCSQGTTSATPVCVSDYQICENAAIQYENSSTTCSCSQTSTQPYCCTSTTTQSCSTTQQCTTLPTACASEEIFLVVGTDPNGDTISLPVSNPSYLCYWFTNGQWEYWNGTYFIPASGPYQFTFSGCSWPYYGITGIPIYENCVLTGSGGSCSQTSCNPVTTCTPVTTQSCTTEP